MRVQALITISTTNKKKKNFLARTLQIESFDQPLFSMLVENIFVQHAGAECFGQPNLSCHVYFFLKNI